MRIAALLLALSAMPAAAQAPVAPGPVTYGPGHKLCSDWSAAEADDGAAMANRFFVAGVMSAYNIYVSPAGFDIGRGLAPADMKAFMHDRCAAHPAETIATAATAWIAMLKTRQGQ